MELYGYGRCLGTAVDPVEKKPLRMFRPGTRVLSTGPPGCNLFCSHCQNWRSSHGSPPPRSIPPRELAELAAATSDGLAFTYTEPVIWYEYVMDTAPLVRSLGGFTVMVSNGFVNPEPLADLIGVTDAWNIDLKGWRNGFYERNCRGGLEPVLETLRAIAASGTHLEVTYLLIPGENDDPGDWSEVAAWVAANCGEDTPMHVSRYFPGYRRNTPATPTDTVYRASEVFRRHLRHVFMGNV